MNKDALQLKPLLSPLHDGGKPKAAALDRVPQLKRTIEQDVNLFKLATLSTHSSDDLLEDVVGDWRLARFLQSVEGNVEEARHAYQSHLKWRLQLSVDKVRHQIRNKPYRVGSFPHAQLLVGAGMKKPCIHAGWSRLGDLVHLESIGQGSPKDFIKVASDQQLVEHYVGFFEARSQLLEAESLRQSRVVRSVQIRDMSRFGFHLMAERGAFGVLQALSKLSVEVRLKGSADMLG
jgi:hypothetical protein